MNMVITYKNEDISSKLTELDSREQKVLKIRLDGQQYVEFSRLENEIRKLLIFYNPDEEQEKAMKSRFKKYCSYQDEIEKKANTKARKKNFFSVVRFCDRLQTLCEDQEAIRANFILLQRNYNFEL